MKTHHYIFLTTLLFVIVFYDQNVGLNLGIIGIIYAVLTFFRTPERNRTKTFLLGSHASKFRILKNEVKQFVTKTGTSKRIFVLRFLER